MLTESGEEFSDLHSIFRLCALRYCLYVSVTNTKAHATFVNEHIFFLAMYCFISFLFVFYVISVNNVYVIFCK